MRHTCPSKVACGKTEKQAAEAPFGLLEDRSSRETGTPHAPLTTSIFSPPVLAVTDGMLCEILWVTKVYAYGEGGNRQPLLPDGDDDALDVSNKGFLGCFQK